MIKVDLHLHSPLSKLNGDYIKWDSLYDSLLNLKNHNISIASFSDHNTFDRKFYLEAFNLAKTANILLLPAIEVNVVRLNGIIANIIFVFKENLNDSELDLIENITKKIPKRGISLSLCNQLFQQFETIKIPHVGKSDFFSYEDLLEIEYDAIEISNEKNHNYLSVSKKVNTSVVAFSDTHKWDLYPEQGKLITIFDNLESISFDGLKKALQKNKNFTKRRIDV